MAHETALDDRIANALTVDVEDYFQVSAFDPFIDRNDWDTFPSRVESHTDLILSMFDEAGVKGTFFTLGWVATRFPQMIKRICDQGHELASHGWEHTRLTFMEPEQFREDVRRTKEVLEDLSGQRVKGYRAPSYSIDRHNDWAHDILAETGHLYSSSVAPINHDLYGIPDAPRFAHRRGTAQLLEIPISTVALGRKNWPSVVEAGFGSILTGFSRGRSNESIRSTSVPVSFIFILGNSTLISRVSMVWITKQHFATTRTLEKPKRGCDDC